MSHVFDRPRLKRRIRGETVGVIVLTVFLAVCGASLTAVAVAFSGQAITTVSKIR